MQRTALAILAMALACLSGTANAEETQRQLDPHEHGHGMLNIALEGNKLELELEVPGMDIVGFEHAASTPEQHALVDNARKDLGEGILSLLVLPDAAGCKLISNSVAVVAEEHHDAGEEQDKDASAHEDDEDGHNVFRGTYQLTCSAPEQLTRIDFRFFERFTGSEELDVTVIGEKGQSAYEVKRKSPQLELAR